MSLHFARFSSGPASPQHCMLWRPTLYKMLPSPVAWTFKCFSISGFTTAVRIYHVEAWIAQCLDSRLCVLGILVRFLTGSREPFFPKKFMPALDPTNLPTQRVRGGGLSQNQNSQNVKQKIILLRLLYNSPNQAWTASLLRFLNHTQLDTHTHTHIHTHFW